MRMFFGIPANSNGHVTTDSTMAVYTAGSAMIEFMRQGQIARVSPTPCMTIGSPANRRSRTPISSFFGILVGDVLGAPHEFHSRDT
jgi:hypothetical protein